MNVMERIKRSFSGLKLNAMSAAIAALAVSIFLLAAALSSFTIQVSLLRRDIPRTMDRMDKQITALQHILNSAESSGQSFSSGLNQDITSGINKGMAEGMSQGLIDLPVNSVKVVGGKIGSTVINTGQHTYNFWEAAKQKLFFWQAKNKTTSEAEQKK